MWKMRSLPNLLPIVLHVYLVHFVLLAGFCKALNIVFYKLISNLALESSTLVSLAGRTFEIRSCLMLPHQLLNSSEWLFDSNVETAISFQCPLLRSVDLIWGIIRNKSEEKLFIAARKRDYNTSRLNRTILIEENEWLWLVERCPFCDWIDVD